MTAWKRVGSLPTHRLAVRHSVDYSSSDHFASDDSLRDSSSSSSSIHHQRLHRILFSDDLSDSSSDLSLPALSSGMRPSRHLCSLVPSIPRSSAAITDRPSHDSSSVSPSRKRSKSPAASVSLSSPIPGALSFARADLLPLPKRIRSSGFATDLEVSSTESFEPSRSRGTNLGMDDDVERSDGIDIDPEIQEEINKCVTYADALRASARVVVEAVDREEIETGVRGQVEVRFDRVTHPVITDDIPEPAQEEGAVEVMYETLGNLVQRFHDHTEEILVHCVRTIKSIQRDQGHKITATGQQSADMLERIKELERDNTRLRDMMDVASQRVTQSQRKELHVQREMRQIRRFRLYDRMRIARLEACTRMTMPNTQSGASRTCEGINKQIDHRVAGALGARDVARNLEPIVGGGGEQKEVHGNGGNGNEGNLNRGYGNGGANGNGNRNRGVNGYNPRGFVHVARECTYPDFLKCQPLSFTGTEGVVGIKAAYAMSWTELMKLMTEVHCPRNKIQKMEIELWNLAVKGNGLTAYTRRFQELVLLCTKMVPNEENKVERFIGGFPDNIQGNVIAVEPSKLQDAIRIANNLMDQKLKGCARSAENKRRLENNRRDNRGQQPVFKRQNVRGQSVARAYTARNNEKKGHVGSLPYCNKCKLHHAGSCTVRCGNCKRVGHMTRDYKVAVTPKAQRALVGNQLGIVCYECGRPGHFKKDCLKLRNQNRGNKTRNKNGNKTGNQTIGNEATARA
ncbi:putative reverse transcriptase domain-containing protein [Tanacetum coccineum]